MITLEQIIMSIKIKFDIYEHKWVFFSWFDKTDKLLFSEGMLFTNKTIKEITEHFYKEYIKKEANLDLLVIDVIKNKIELKSSKELMTIDTKKYWLFIWDKESSKGWVMLPDTKDVKDIKQAISLIKQKSDFKNSLVNIFAFTTERMTVSSKSEKQL